MSKHKNLDPGGMRQARPLDPPMLITFHCLLFIKSSTFRNSAVGLELNVFSDNVYIDQWNALCGKIQ